MSTVTQILNWISSSLLLPVIVLLLAALAGALVSLGGFCATYLLLLQERKKRRDLLAALRSGKLDIETLQPDGIFSSHIADMAKLGWNELECEKYISEVRQNYDRELERTRFLAKTAPMLGLMGTLIPMGPALAGLASGNIGNMAYNMQIAFATTVVGCVIAGIALLVNSVKKHWYAEEIGDLVYVLDRTVAARGEKK